MWCNANLRLSSVSDACTSCVYSMTPLMSMLIAPVHVIFNPYMAASVAKSGYSHYCSTAAFPAGATACPACLIYGS